MPYQLRTFRNGKLWKVKVMGEPLQVPVEIKEGQYLTYTENGKVWDCDEWGTMQRLCTKEEVK